jgi:hypothetical protein
VLPYFLVIIKYNYYRQIKKYCPKCNKCADIPISYLLKKKNFGPGATLQNLEYTKSDHRPLLLDTDPWKQNVNRNRKQRRFEARWFQEKDFRDRVQQAWDVASESVAGDGVLAKLSLLHAELHEWDTKVLKKPKKRLEKAQSDLEKAMRGPMTDENDAIAKEMAALIEILLEQEETHWMQRSRANWLKQGDLNTIFFHNYASAKAEEELYSQAEIWQ